MMAKAQVERVDLDARPGHRQNISGDRSNLTAAGRRAFTLLEILLCLAIIALLGSVLIGGAAHLLNEQPTSADDVFWKAVRDARKAALKAEHDMRLKFDKEKKQFVLVDGLAPAVLAADGITKEETPVKVFPIPSVGDSGFSVE